GRGEKELKFADPPGGGGLGRGVAESQLSRRGPPLPIRFADRPPPSSLHSGARKRGPGGGRCLSKSLRGGRGFESSPPAAAVHINRIRGHERTGVGAHEQDELADLL